MKYHSTVGRSDYMKMLALGRAKAEAGTPSFHDLDEVIASPVAEWKRPWWVRGVDELTVEVDWDSKQRFDGRKMQQVSWAKYVGEEAAKRLTKLTGGSYKAMDLGEQVRLYSEGSGDASCRCPGRVSWHQLPWLL